jgi:hypothetical protein
VHGLWVPAAQDCVRSTPPQGWFDDFGTPDTWMLDIQGAARCVCLFVYCLFYHVYIDLVISSNPGGYSL